MDGVLPSTIAQGSNNAADADSAGLMPERGGVQDPSSLALQSLENSTLEVSQRETLQLLPEEHTTSINTLTRLYVLRSSQLDADALNTELKLLLTGQFINIFSLFKTNIKALYEPEINAILEWLVSEAALYSTGSTYALELQNLKYRDEFQHTGQHELSLFNAPVPKGRRLIHALLRIGGPWIHARLTRYLTTHGWSDGSEGEMKYRIWRLVQRLELLYKIISLGNFIAFLYNGRYRSFLDRLLGMRIVYSQQTMSRMISFEFMNRQLVWSAFTEFFLSIIPFVNMNFLKRMVYRHFKQRQQLDLPAHLCAICHIKNRPSATLHIPYETNCKHTYCYYCIKTELMIDSAFPCPRCGEKVRDISRYIDPVSSLR
ncbi:hypothetical protein BASA61_001009 [Batrachochytrium salamandrivorans]|nr:hypothetical protein BASA61_001009 [Batrachochytrium salamandrivorans]